MRESNLLLISLLLTLRESFSLISGNFSLRASCKVLAMNLRAYGNRWVFSERRSRNFFDQLCNKRRNITRLAYSLNINSHDDDVKKSYNFCILPRRHYFLSRTTSAIRIIYASKLKGRLFYVDRLSQKKTYKN